MKTPLFTAILLCSAALGLSGSAARALPVHPAASGQAAVLDTSRRCDLNQINLRVANDGVFAFDRELGNADLIYPKGSGRTAMFAAGLWLVAKVNGQWRGMINEFGSECGPGGISNGTFEDPQLPEFRTYKVVRYRGDPQDTARVLRTPAELASDPTLDLLLHDSWSAYLAGAAAHGAPVRMHRLPLTATPDPTDSVDVLGPDVLGDEMLWCVYNDADPARHTIRGGETAPLGVEVRQTFFAVDAPGPLGSTLFVRFQILNRGPNTLDSLLIGLWNDPDLGNPFDDAFASDSALALAYCYNVRYQDAAYGAAPPALGYVLLHGLGPASIPLHATALSGPVGGTDPQDIIQSRNLLLGLQSTGDAVLDPRGIPSPFWYTGDPVVGVGWLVQYPTDRRLILTTGPVTMAPGDTAVVDAALMIGQGVDNLASVANLKCAASAVKQFYDAGFPEGSTPGLGCPTAAVESCPRSLGFWRQQCSQLSASDLTRLAKCVDDSAILFGFTPGQEAIELCNILNAPSGDLRAQTQREQLVLLSNVCSAKLGFVFAPPDSAFLGEGIELWAGSVGAKSVGQLAAPAVASPCFCADSLQIALVGQPLTDPSVALAYQGLLADLKAVDGGIGVGPTCLWEAFAWPSLGVLIAAPELVTVAWGLGAASGLPVAIYRLEASDWVRVGLSPPDGSGIAYYEDRNVIPEHRYSYRIGVNPDGREQFYGEGSITVPPAPPAPRFALLGATPNPTFDALRVALTLPNRSPLEIEVFDLSGRKVASHRNEQPELGHSVVDLGSNLRAGIYVVRVHQAGLSASTKAVVLR